MADWDDDEKVARREQTPRSGGLRHDVAIPAHIMWVGGDDIEAQILDVSSTGMYLSLRMFIDQGDVDTLALGSTVTVLFAPDEANAPDVVARLRGEVARRDPHGIGLRFQNLDAGQKQALRTAAVKAVESRSRRGDAAASAEQVAGPKIDSRLVSSACLKVLERRLANILWTLRAEVVVQLRAMKTSAKDTGGGSAREDAELIEEKGTAISRTAERRAIQSFAEIAGLDSTQQIVLAHLKRKPAAAAASGGEKLGIVGDAAVESRVILEDTCQRLETALSSKSFGVNVRLANVLRRRIDEDAGNPLLPKVMCRILWQAVTGYCDSPRVHTCLRTAIVRDIAPLLAELYEQIDQVLDEHGVPDSFWTGDSEGKNPRK